MVTKFGIQEIIKFRDPLKKTLSSWKRPNGIIIKRVSIPIGVIGVIYESRPNVTSDVSALCFKTGNVVILRGGSEAFHSNKILAKLFKRALKKKKCDENCVKFVEHKKICLLLVLICLSKSNLFTSDTKSVCFW